MKKSLLILLAAACLFVLAACTGEKDQTTAAEQEEELPAVGEENPTPETEKIVVRAESPVTPAGTETDNVRETVTPVTWCDEEGAAAILVELPEGWTHGEVSEDYRRGIEIRPEDGDSGVTLCYYPSMFGVCGTGLTEEKIELGDGVTAFVGYYDGGKNWSFVAFHGLERSFAATNEGLTGDAAEEALALVLKASLEAVTDLHN